MTRTLTQKRPLRKVRASKSPPRRKPRNLALHTFKHYLLSLQDTASEVSPEAQSPGCSRRPSFRTFSWDECGALVLPSKNLAVFLDERGVCSFRPSFCPFSWTAGAITGIIPFSIVKFETIYVGLADNSEKYCGLSKGYVWMTRHFALGLCASNKTRILAYKPYPRRHTISRNIG